MPEATNRRAVLGAVLAAGVVASVPAAAAIAAPATSGEDLDAELFELIGSARAARARYEAATDALEEACERTEKVPPPEALIVTEADTRIWKNLKAGEPFDGAHFASMRPRQERRRSGGWTFSSGLADASYVATLDDKERAIVEIIAASEVREDQLVPALDEWKEMRRLARDRSGETAAKERSRQFYNEMDDACARVATTRARTLSGMLAKLAFIAPDFEAEEMLDLGTAAEMGSSEQILVSVAVDYKLGVEGVQQAT
jgi:hypothetical protein